MRRYRHAPRRRGIIDADAFGRCWTIATVAPSILAATSAMPGPMCMLVSEHRSGPGAGCTRRPKPRPLRQADDGCTQRCGDPCATVWNNAEGLLRRSKACSLHGDGIAARREMVESERSISTCVHALVRGRQGDMTPGKGLQPDRHHLTCDDTGVIAELRRDARPQRLVLRTERINARPYASSRCERSAETNDDDDMSHVHAVRVVRLLSNAEPRAARE